MGDNQFFVFHGIAFTPQVQGTQGKQWNTVDMNADKVSCTCNIWMKTELPCNHMFAIAEHTHLSWTDLPETFR